ncbi:endothelin-converting enzyme 2-like isoform X1 [Daphnia pulex]|uniref:endothelin-converting enzyme 2-like isoform X1 n=1 Tax=Daphnia pulex TaxID=6669 RepID=UPI001EE0B62D|nr:endothelin-converting enzyme 2-like isoform X1 [Daphnia pulex]XP_046444688.1 endothelin-converting enzyme 2-like isoform X1 [Daphnia pulex]XP_046444689.1 endothelin-converting enzyme 2-like isoform X1 [Daphnia pulex]
MDLPIQHYKENGAEEQLQQSLAMRTEWEPCLAHHPPLQSFGCDAELAERGGGPPPPPPPSKRRFRSPTSRNKPNDSAMCATMDDRHGKMRETLMERQVQKAGGLLGVTSRGLLILGLLLVFILILLVIIVVLAALWPRTKAQEAPKVCDTPACLRAAAQVIGSMENHTSPCTNFWNYACHSWLVSNPLPPWASKWSIREELAHRAHEEMRKLIETMPHPTRVDSLSWKLKYFYESCTALEHIVVPEQKLIRVIDQMGGWGVLRSFSVYSWNFRMVLRRLHAEYGVNAFFRVDVVAHPNFPDKSIVRISPDGLGLPDRNYYYREPDHAPDVPRRRLSQPGTINTYKVFLKDAVQLLGATSLEATKFAEEVFHFEKRIAELTPNTEDIINPVKSIQILNVADLQRQSFSIPWLEILRAIYPTTVFDDSTELLITSPDYLKDISSVVSSSDRSTLNNYLMWRLAHNYLPYLSREFWEVLDIHKRDTLGAKESVDRWEMCIVTTQKYFRLAMGSIYSKNNVALKDSRNGVAIIYESLKNGLASSLSGSSLYSPSLRSRALEKLATLSVQVGYPEQVLASSYLDDFYTAMSVQVNDFLGNILYGVHFLRKVEERILLNPLPEHKWLAYLSKDTITYIPESNRIIIPEHLLLPPFYSVNFPQPILLGSLGVQLAVAMVASVSQHGVLYDGQGVLIDRESTIGNDSLSLTANQRKCLVDALHQKKIDDEDFLKRTVFETLVQLAGVRQALKVVTNPSMEQRRTEYKALEFLTHPQLFFVAYAQSMCSHTTAKHRDMERSTTFRLGDEEMLRATMLQMPEFTEAFMCNSSSLLHHGKVCGRII